MGTEILGLQHELEQAKDNLKNVDEHLKKLIGRDPSELPIRISKRHVVDDKGRPGFKNLTNPRVFAFENLEPPNKKRSTSVFNRLSDKVPEVSQKGLISKVIVSPKEIPSREEALQAQNNDEKFKARNRRMFGSLLGTLQKFQQEETKLKSKEDKRAQLEKKIEEHEIREKEEIRRERQELFLNRKKRQAEIKIIELKMLRMMEYNAWEESQKPRKKFIITKSKPQIHFLPHKLNDKGKELLTSSKAEIERLIDIKKKETTEELKHIEERIKRNFDNRVISKSHESEIVDCDIQDTEDQFEDMTGSQDIPTNLTSDLLNNENWQEQTLDECSENYVQNTTTKDTKYVSEKLVNLQVTVPFCELQSDTKGILKVPE